MNYIELSLVVAFSLFGGILLLTILEIVLLNLWWNHSSKKKNKNLQKTNKSKKYVKRY